MTAKKPQNSHSTDSAPGTGDAGPIEADIDEGHPYALAQLYQRFRRQIHSYIYRLLGNQEDADDVTQEVFLRAYTSWDNLYDRDNLSAWLYRIATNLCVDILRRRKRISWWPLVRRNRLDETFEGSGDEDSSYLPADSGGIPEVAERELIRLALANMPEEYAVVLVLSAAQGVPYREIAAVVGISANAAATRISRAKKMFIEQYQRLSSAPIRRANPASGGLGTNPGCQPRYSLPHLQPETLLEHSSASRHPAERSQQPFESGSLPGGEEATAPTAQARRKEKEGVEAQEKRR